MSTTEQTQGLRATGGVLIAAGAISVICGVLAIAYPGITLLALAIIAGVNILVLAVLALIDAVSGEADTGARVLAGIVGVLGLLAGVVMLRRPGETLLVLLLVLGLWLVVSGVVDGVLALVTAGDRAIRLLRAAVDLIVGVLILALPELSLKTLAVLAGIAFLIRGALAIYAGWQVRRADVVKIAIA